MLDDGPLQDRCLKEQKPIKKPISLEILDAINKAVTEVKNNGLESYKQIEHHLKQISRNADKFNPENIKTSIKNMTKENFPKAKKREKRI